MENFGFSKVEVKLIQESFNKVCDTNCWELLYDKLFELDPKMSELFKGDLKEQQHRIMTMMRVVVEGMNNPQIIIPAIQKMGQRHNEDYEVRPEYYNNFKKSLIYAFSESLGNDFTPEIKKVWEKFYDLLSTTMKNY